MERAVALKKLRRLLGDKLGYRIDPKAPDAEVRAQARTDAKRLGEEYQIASNARRARLAALLAADAEYQQLEAEATRLRNARDKASGTSHHYRFTVGLVSELFFSVKAQGDSWEDVIAQLEAKR
jgi:predicted component of type VI protein secretion system